MRSLSSECHQSTRDEIKKTRLQSRKPSAFRFLARSCRLVLASLRFSLSVRTRCHLFRPMLDPCTLLSSSPSDETPLSPSNRFSSTASPTKTRLPLLSLSLSPKKIKTSSSIGPSILLPSKRSCNLSTTKIKMSQRQLFALSVVRSKEEDKNNSPPSTRTSEPVMNVN